MKLIKLFTLILIMPFINGVLKAQSEIPIELLEIIVPINGPTIEPDILDDDSPVLLSCPKISPLYNDSSFFMINPNSIEKVVRVNFIVFQKNDGSGNFQADDPEHIKIFDDFELALNNCFKNLHQICGLINKDAKIRFVCTPTFVRDSNLWKGIGVSQWVQTFENTPGSPSGINVLFYINESAYIKNIIENDSTYYYGQDIWSANLPNSTNFDQASRINAPDLFVKHHWMKNWVTVHTGLPWIPTIYNWFIGSMSSSALGHEIGHSLGLLDIFYPLNNCDSANIMRQQFGGGRNYLSDTQINKIHNSLAVTSVRKYVNDPTALDVPLVITDTKFIDFDVKLYRDIIIESGAQLTITCKVLMPSSGKITIKPGGKLALDGGILTSSCPYKLWYGILVAGNDTLPQTPESNQGVLELKNGAIIENANNAIATYGLDLNGNISWSSFGGIIKADNTTFRNNRRSIEFMKYPPNGTNPVPQNVSYFNNCKFIVNDNNLFGNRPLWSQITMWAVTGVQ
ncbi:MAG: hypothetical protein FWE72_09730, partial [Spirochaetaceae bacterium]|nr:hypothetical protein [Spirochaetaceae bacterium]